MDTNLIIGIVAAVVIVVLLIVLGRSTRQVA